MWSSHELPTLWSWSPKMCSSHKLPNIQISTGLLTLFPEDAEFVESAGNPHCGFKNAEFEWIAPSMEFKWIPQFHFQKCGVHLNCPFFLWRMWSSNELPTVVFKTAEFVSSPHFVFQNAESARTLHWVFEKCGVHMNSPLCGVHLNCCLVFKKCGVQTNSPLWF